MWLLTRRFVLEPARKGNVRQPSITWLCRLVRWEFLSHSSALKSSKPTSPEDPFPGKQARTSVLRARAAESLGRFGFVQTEVRRSFLLGFLSERCSGVTLCRQSWETVQQISAVISVATPVTSGTENNSLWSKLGWEGQVQIHKIMRNFNSLVNFTDNL